MNVTVYSPLLLSIKQKSSVMPVKYTNMFKSDKYNNHNKKSKAYKNCIMIVEIMHS